MCKLLSHFLKQKRILFFVILLSVILGITIPKTAYGESWSFFFKQCLPGGSNPWVYCLTGGTLAVPTSSELKQAYKDQFDWLSDIGKGVLNGVLSAVGILIIGITGALAGLASELLMWVIKPNFVPFSFTGISGPNPNPAVAAGWPVVRDLANMLIVLGFVVIGISTTLRIREYEAKKLLPKLIIAAILTNFSLLICGLFIDASNIATVHFLKTGGFEARTISSILEAQVGAVATNFTANKDIASNIGAIGGIVFLNIMEMIIFFLYFFLFLFRYVALWILVILSPLAFVTGVFPFTKNISQKWWSNFIAWCIIGIPGSFFIFLADTISSSLINNPQGVSIMMAHMVPGVLLIAGFLFTLQVSAMGTSAVIGLATGAGGFAMGAVSGGGKGLAKIADKATGGVASNAGRSISSGMGKAMERVGLRQTGATATLNNQRVEEKAKTMAAAYNSEPTAKANIQKLAKKGRGVEAAAAMKVVAENNDMHSVFKDKNGKADLNAMNKRVVYAQSVGASRKTFTDVHPSLEQFNNERINKIQKDNPSYTPEQSRQEAVNQTMARKGRADMEKLHPDAIDHYTVGAMSQQQIGWIYERGTPAAQEKLEKFADPNSDESKKLGAHGKTLTGNQGRNLATNMAYLKSRGGQPTTAGPGETGSEAQAARSQDERDAEAWRHLEDPAVKQRQAAEEAAAKAKQEEIEKNKKNANLI